jgi:hypothetical protein
MRPVLIFESLRELGVFLKREVGASDGTFERVLIYATGKAQRFAT